MAQVIGNEGDPSGNAIPNTFAVLGDSELGCGVIGTSTQNVGVYGISADNNGVVGIGPTGVVGRSSLDIPEYHSQSIGVRGDGYVGIYGSGKTGVIGKSDQGSGQGMRGVSTASYGRGVVGIAQGANGSGIHGVAGNNATVAALFEGHVEVIGTINKSACMFKIDHPLDPSNKYLYHSVVESPDMKNIYDGVAILNARGEAEVRLPRWFDALNNDFRYQLTALGAPSPHLHIKQEISKNSFKIGGGAKGAKVSWQVTGIRKDVWANAHRIPVEERKNAKERGSYLHPELHGKSIEKKLHYNRYRSHLDEDAFAGMETKGTRGRRRGNGQK